MGLGDYLRQERENRGISVEQVASATKINARLIHAIEADHYSDLPAKPFVRGFVNSYCRFVGLDAEDVLTRYGSFLEEKSHERPLKEGGHSGYAFEKKDTERSRTLLGIVLGAFVVLGAVVLLVIKPVLKKRRLEHVEKLNVAHKADKESVTAKSEANPEKENTKENSPEKKADDKQPETAAAKPEEKPSHPTKVEVDLKIEGAEAETEEAKTDSERQRKKDPLNKGDGLFESEVTEKVVYKSLADVWVRYKIDELPVMRFVLRSDRLLVLRAEKVIRIQVSNPDALRYRHKGDAYLPLKGSKNTTLKNETTTMIFPAEQFEKIREPFPGMGPLPKTPEPAKRDASNN